MEQEIIQTLKDNPELSHKKVAKKHGVTQWDVSRAQHAFLKTFMKRDSIKWTLPRYGKN